MIEINPKNFIGMGVLVEIVDMPIGQIKPYKKNHRKNEKAIPEVSDLDELFQEMNDRGYKVKI